MKKRAIIISNGRIKNKKFYKNLIKKSDYVICVNGGSKHARTLNLIPNIIIGDMDSLSKSDYQYFLKKGCKIKKYHPVKDKTDMQLAIEHAIKLGLKKILMLCVFGERLDHILANIFLLIKITKKGVKARIIDEFNEIFLVRKSGVVEGEIGETVSLIPLSLSVTGITTRGLEYRLENGMLKIDDTLGVSNILTKKRAMIKVGNGILLVVKSKYKHKRMI